MATERDASWVPRSDVTLQRSGNHLYVCRSDGSPLRLRLGDGPADGRLKPDDLPPAAARDLVERGLVVPSDRPLNRHPSFGRFPRGTAEIQVVGDDPLSNAVAAVLTTAGVTVVPEVSAAGAVVLPLTCPEEVLAETAEQVSRKGIPVVVFAPAGSRVLFAVLRPPGTACPLCLTTRIKASRPDRVLGGFPLQVLLGATTDTRWPSTATTAGLIAHQAVRAAAPTAVDDGPVELVELDLDTCGRVSHPLLHTPHCPACREHVPPFRTSPYPLSTAPAVPLAESARRMRRAVDPLTGIVAGVRTIHPRQSAEDSVVAWARGGTDTTWFSPVRASTVGGATKRDEPHAEVCAIGEVLERYSAGIYDPDEFVRASLAELGSAAVDPRTLPLGSPQEYETVAGRLHPYRPDVVVDWVEGVELDTGTRRYLPACTVYVPYRPMRKAEHLLMPISTGLAAGSTLAQALRSALLEVVERDAVAIFWHNRLVVPTVQWQHMPHGPARQVLERMSDRGIRLTVKDITTDLGVPAVIVLGRFDTPERPIALCGFRADVDYQACLLGAALELEHCVAMYARFTELGRELEQSAEPRDIWDFATYYCHADRISVLDFMYEGPHRQVPEPTEPLSDADAVAEVVQRVSASGYHPVAVDITPVDVAECGVTVVRAVIPGLQPVTFMAGFRHLGGRRLYEAPVRMGLRDVELTEKDLNPYPAPLG